MRLPGGRDRRTQDQSSLSGGAGPALPPRAAVALVVPFALLATAIVVQRRRSGSTAIAPASSNGATPASVSASKVQPQARHKPRNRARYYALTLVINALERESTRKAILSALHAARNRA